MIARFQNNDVQTGGSAQSMSDDSLTRQHVERALAVVPVRGVPGSVVLDSVNGAGCEGGRQLFASLGVPYEHLYGEPHGVFARPAEPIPAHLGDLCDRVRDSEAVVGFAQDPDADRLVLVDERGVPIHPTCPDPLWLWLMTLPFFSLFSFLSTHHIQKKYSNFLMAQESPSILKYVDILYAGMKKKLHQRANL